MQEEKKEISIKDIINKRKEHSRRVDIKLIMKAYRLASEKHKGQKEAQVNHILFTLLMLHIFWQILD